MKANPAKAMNYFYRNMGGWVDTMTSDLSPAVLASKGWTQCTKAEYNAYRRGNEVSNAANEY